MVNDSPDRTRGAIALLLCMPAFVWTAELLAGTPLLILAAAVAPAMLIAAAILVAQRGGGRPGVALAFALAWGAIVAAWLSTTGNGLARPWIDAATSGDDRAITALVVAPLLEEAAKALGLAVLLVLGSRSFRGIRDGIVLGALVGAGFVFTENLLYLGISMLQGGKAGLLRAIYLRGVLGAATHAVFTACAGAGLGWWASEAARGERPRWIGPVLGLVAAHLQHVVWNAIAAPTVAAALCGAEAGVCRDVPTMLAVFGQSTVITLAFLAPGIALLVSSARRERRE